MLGRVAPRRSALCRFAALASTIIVVGAGLVAAEPAADASPAHSWTIARSVNQGTNTNFLYGVSCPSPRTCTAVGFYTSPGVDRTLVESWNGSAWKIASSPNPGGVWNFLYSVSCPSENFCAAVGRYENPSGTNRTLVETWNGVAWSVSPSPNRGTAANVLSSVSCVSTTACVAVGSSQAGAVTRTLVERWNGHAWSIDETSANHAPSSYNALAGVSCAATSCTAVGTYENTHGVKHTLVESWNAGMWSLAPSPNNGTLGSELTGVSCASPASCQAVGTFATAGSLPRTLAASWNGTKWTLVSTPNRDTGANTLSGVSCVAATSCKAVGWYATRNAGVHQTLTEAWDGRTWRIVGSPNPATSPVKDNYLGVRGSALNGVSCLSASVCTGAGFYVDGSGHDRALVESFK